jgi:type 1 glutamine amidotransferase
MREAMIVWGGWPGHEPEQGAHVVAGVLKENGFKVHLENSTKAFSNPALMKLSLVVPIITMSSVEKQEVASLTAAIESGVGFAGYHGGMCDAFRDSPEYQFICGGQYVAHPGDESKDYYVDYTVNVIKPDDPIMKGIKDFPYRSEQYYMHVDPSNEVLATTTFTGEYGDWLEGVVMPVVWKRRHGKGRVFYSSLGHVSKEFEVPEMKTILTRGLLWAAK